MATYDLEDTTTKLKEMTKKAREIDGRDGRFNGEQF